MEMLRYNIINNNPQFYWTSESCPDPRYETINSEPFATRLCDMVTFSSTDCFTKFYYNKIGSETKG